MHQLLSSVPLNPLALGLQIASKLERALGEHRRELDARDAESAELRSALDALGAAHAAAVSEVQELRSAINQMQVREGLRGWQWLA